MRNLKYVGLGAAGIIILGTVGLFGWKVIDHNLALKKLAERTKSDLVFVKGGSFQAGNYQVEVRLPDGTQETRWVIEPQFSRTPREVALDSFYIATDEASAADHALFLADQDHYPPLTKLSREDGSSRMTWAEAHAYCTWLGELVEIPLRLPTENEWEYAARSRGAAVLFATNDGEYRWGQNVQDNDLDTPQEPVRSFPPNPLGLRDMVEGSYEWVSDTAPEDPKGIRIAKGSSSRSTSFSETIPGRYESTPLNSKQIDIFSEDRTLGARYKALAALGEPIHTLQGTARCVAPVTQPPELSGFGKPGGSFDTVPEAFGPYQGPQRKLLETE